MESQTATRQPKPYKVEAVQNLNDKVSRARSLYFTENKGLSVAEITELRRKCWEANVEYLVCKNTFTRRVMEEQGYPDALKHLTGPTALAFGYEDPAAPAKVLFDFAEKNEKLVLKGGIFEGKVITESEIKAIKDLPSREQALAMVIATIFAPVQSLYNVINNILRDFVSVVDQIAEKKK